MDLITDLVIPLILAFGGFFLVRRSIRPKPHLKLVKGNEGEEMEPGKINLKENTEAFLRNIAGHEWDGKLLLWFTRNPKRGSYNDHCVVLCGNVWEKFPCNVDPSGERPGHGFGENKGRGTIKRGFYPESHCIGRHKKVYPALVQCNHLKILRDADEHAQNVVEIDGRRYYEELNRFGGFNIHPGGYENTGSAGCLTFHPDYWPKFISLVVSLMKQENIRAVDILIN